LRGYWSGCILSAGLAAIRFKARDSQGVGFRGSDTQTQKVRDSQGFGFRAFFTHTLSLKYTDRGGVCFLKY